MRIRTVRDIGNAIRARRRALGWSQAELASRASVSRKWVSEAERGDTVAGVVNLLAVIEALGATLDLRLPGGVEPANAPADDIDLDAILEAHRGG